MLQNIHVHRTLVFLCCNLDLSPEILPCIFVHPAYMDSFHIYCIYVWTTSSKTLTRHLQKDSNEIWNHYNSIKIFIIDLLLNNAFTWMQHEFLSSNLALTSQVVFNSRMKHWTGPHGVKLRPAPPYRHVRSVLLSHVTQHRLVIPCLHFATTYQYHLQGPRYSKERRQQVWNYLTLFFFVTLSIA